MVTSNPLNPVNGQQIVMLPGGVQGSAQALIVFATAPSAGAVTLEVRAPGTAAWKPITKAVAQSITSGALAVRIDGPVGAIRITFAGLVGGVDPQLWIDANANPTGLFAGLGAITTQPYTEANVKLGVQFSMRVGWPSSNTIAMGATVKIRFTTGAKPVTIKLRDLHYVSEELELNLYKNPVGVTGGTAVPIRNYNDRIPVATTVSAQRDVTTTSDGTLFDGPEYFSVHQRLHSAQQVLSPQAVSGCWHQIRCTW